MIFAPCMFQKVNVSFLSAFFLCSQLCSSAPQLLFDKLRLFNSHVLSLFFLLLSWFHQCTFRLSVYLVMTHVIPRSVHFLCMHLYFLTFRTATIIILERVSLLFASPSHPTLENAFNQACSQYEASDTHNALKDQFLPPPKQYSISQFTEFVLGHRL